MSAWVYLTSTNNAHINFLIFKDKENSILQCLTIGALLNKTITYAGRYDEHQIHTGTREHDNEDAFLRLRDFGRTDDITFLIVEILLFRPLFRTRVS